MSEIKIVPVYLSGGSGTRLWPLSRSKRPKQFIQLLEELSLFQMTVGRLADMENHLPPVVVCNQDHRFTVAEQLDEMDESERTIILEPCGRNTAPAIATAALSILDNPNKENCLILVLPSDHVIEDVDGFMQAIQQAVTPAQEGQLVTFGVAPNKPATGYGYIKATDKQQSDYFDVEMFVEKPDAENARKYVESGDYYWNAGIFLFDPKVYLEELSKFSPDIVQHCQNAIQAAETDLDFLRLNEEDYQKCENISIDYAVMEQSDKVSMIPLGSQWSDMGSWSSVWEYGDKDEHGNVSKGDVWTHNVKNSYLHAESKIISAVGVDNLVIIETLDGVLVANKSNDEDVKYIVKQLVDANRSEAILHRKVYRPWGHYDSVDSGERFQVKRITVTPGETLSLQKHFHRAEHWIVVTGTAEVTCDDKVSILTENEAAHIPLGSTHRLHNPGKIPLEIIEVQSGAYLEEDDIQRFIDTYGRT